MNGELPPASEKILRKWMNLNREQLLTAWEATQMGLTVKVPPH